MWAIVQTWIPDSDGGFGEVITETCERVAVRDVLVEADVPVGVGDRVRLEYVDGELVRVVRAQ
ncbi:hypothetical protein SAMN04244553_1640 [Nocardia amikacinitolerans]|uniref:Uncharacterized protein n=1 Tax=Nocardia amikacinitolerans TaxID=756689 RepID=A0A285L3Q0_9NOCA|nr:hypothetical protein [Nocardia amikacinitolerans]MCP2277903.1 hypothetical protein [Nocardia amikacinitolerans]MCP2297759.1 hypothetical protein [Nocardia amikacinitolerans]MCP2315511.1 hypothetical protein [Nocardia amikacinitolerans]SNY79542.1 hypothetical protein SAMN04244553_1640 [Nocardia amikacinitolerans]